jgi:hypothetical protein
LLLAIGAVHLWHGWRADTEVRKRVADPELQRRVTLILRRTAAVGAAAYWSLAVIQWLSGGTTWLLFLNDAVDNPFAIAAFVVVAAYLGIMLITEWARGEAEALSAAGFHHAPTDMSVGAARWLRSIVLVLVLFCLALAMLGVLPRHHPPPARLGLSPARSSSQREGAVDRVVLQTKT